MDVSTITVDRQKAEELYRQYRDHKHYSTPVDDEIRQAYRAISKGKLVIRAIESVKAAGVNDAGLPKLALARADQKEVWLRSNRDGSAAMAAENARWGRRLPEGAVSSLRFVWPVGSFPSLAEHFHKRAMLPLIPVHLRPRRLAIRICFAGLDHRICGAWSPHGI